MLKGFSQEAERFSDTDRAATVVYGPQSQAAFREAMAQPRNITLTRAEMELIVGKLIMADNVYWNGGRPLPGHAATQSILAKLAAQCPDCMPGEYQPID